MQAQTEPPVAAKMGSATQPLLRDPDAPPATAGTPAACPEQEAATGAVIADDFNTGLCACCSGPDSCMICLLTACLPCVGHALAADAASGHTSGKVAPLLVYVVSNMFIQGGSAMVLGALARMKLRTAYGLRPDGVSGTPPAASRHPA